MTSIWYTPGVAACELAKLAEERGFSAKNIIIKNIIPREATAVADKAMASGVARLKRSRK